MFVRNWAQQETNREVKYKDLCIEREVPAVMGKRRGHTPSAPLHAGLALGSISPATFFPICGDLPSEHVDLGMPRTHFCEKEGAEGHPATAAPTVQGEAISARRGGTANETRETKRRPCKYFPHLRADSQ